MDEKKPAGTAGNPSKAKKENIHAGHRQRLRKKFLQQGADSLEPHELLELLLFYAVPRKDTNPIAHALINRFGSLQGVLSAPLEELVKVPDVGRNAAVLIQLIAPLYRQSLIFAADHEVVLDTRERIGEYFRDIFIAHPAEVMYQLCLDAKGRKLDLSKVGEGDVGSVGLNVRRILENALRSRAVLVVLAHNHPSGVALPSHEDRTATEIVREALENVGVQLVDHFIVADNDYISMAESGYL